MKNNASYIFSADIIRNLAIFGVVIIHTTNAVYTRLDFFGGLTWWIAIVLDSFSRISIPLFIMLSGYLMLGKEEKLEESLKRILSKIAVPFIFWGLFYFWLGTGTPSLSHINPSIFQKIFYGNVYHLYFLVIIMGLYFVAPMIRYYLRNTSSNSSEFFMKALLVLGVLEVAFQFVFKTCASENFFTRWVPYAGLFVAGYVLGNRKRIGNQKLLLTYFLTLAATLGLNYLYYLLSAKGINFLSSKTCLSHYTDHYLSLNVVAMSISAFLLLLNLKYEKLKKNIAISKLVNSIARASFGIYIVHPFIGRFLEIQFHLAVDFSPLPISIIIFAKLILVFIISYLFTLFFSKIPILRLTLGFNR